MLGALGLPGLRQLDPWADLPHLEERCVAQEGPDPEDAQDPGVQARVSGVSFVLSLSFCCRGGGCGFGRARGGW